MWFMECMKIVKGVECNFRVVQLSKIQPGLGVTLAVGNQTDGRPRNLKWNPHSWLKIRIKPPIFRHFLEFLARLASHSSRETSANSNRMLWEVRSVLTIVREKSNSINELRCNTGVLSDKIRRSSDRNLCQLYERTACL